MAYTIEKEHSVKRLIALVIIIYSITLFVACHNQTKEDNFVKYESGNFHNKNWNETIGTYKKPVIPDKDTALEIAQVIFNNMEKNLEACNYVPQTVFYDESEEVWIVSFWQDSNSMTIGGDCNIAMQKQDGKVLRIWFGE